MPSRRAVSSLDRPGPAVPGFAWRLDLSRGLGQVSLPTCIGPARTSTESLRFSEQARKNAARSVLRGRASLQVLLGLHMCPDTRFRPVRRSCLAQQLWLKPMRAQCDMSRDCGLLAFSLVGLWASGFQCSGLKRFWGSGLAPRVLPSWGFGTRISRALWEP